jgi:leucine-zipper of insertion element IS481
MKLHANAALSLNKRRLLARRIVEEGWSLVEAAEAAETSERTAGKWARRYRAELARPATLSDLCRNEPTPAASSPGYVTKPAVSIEKACSGFWPPWA